MVIIPSLTMTVDTSPPPESGFILVSITAQIIGEVGQLLVWNIVSIEIIAT